MQRSPLSSPLSEEQKKKVKTDAYNSGYDVSTKRPLAIGLGAATLSCWDSGREDVTAGKPSTPRCGATAIGGRSRRRKGRKTVKKAKKGGRRRKTSKMACW